MNAVHFFGGVSNLHYLLCLIKNHGFQIDFYCACLCVASEMHIHLVDPLSTIHRAQKEFGGLFAQFGCDWMENMSSGLPLNTLDTQCSVMTFVFASDRYQFVSQVLSDAFPLDCIHLAFVAQCWRTIARKWCGRFLSVIKWLDRQVCGECGKLQCQRSECDNANESTDQQLLFMIHCSCSFFSLSQRESRLTTW